MKFLIISLTTFYIYGLLKLIRNIDILEKNKFKTKDYIKSIFKCKKFLLFELLFVFLILIAIFTNEKVTGICTIIFYMILALISLKNKPKFKFKANHVRILIMTIILFLVANIPVFMDSYHSESMVLTYNPSFIYYGILYVQMYLLFFFVIISNLINNIFTKKSSKRK
jgi:hypothetical protein